MNAIDPPYTVGAAKNAARILRYLGSRPEPARLTQIAADLQLHASTCLNILRTLADEGLVNRHSNGKIYSIGFGLLALARQSLRRGEDLDAIRQMMEDLARKHGVTVLLWRKLKDELTIIIRVTGGASLHVGADVGASMPLLAGSMGRIIAGFGALDEASLRNNFAKISWHSTIDFNMFMAQAQLARTRGWAMDDGDYNATLSGVSAPILTYGAPVERILNAAIFANQFDAKSKHRLGEELAELAALIANGGA